MGGPSKSGVGGYRLYLSTALSSGSVRGRTPRHPVEKASSLVPLSPSRFVEPVAGGRRQTRPGNYPSTQRQRRHRAFSLFSCHGGPLEAAGNNPQQFRRPMRLVQPISTLPWGWHEPHLAASPTHGDWPPREFRVCRYPPSSRRSD